jgi:hypothetical protein
MDTLGRVTGSVGAFLNIFTVFFDIVWEIITELGPAIDTILRPVLSVVEALGRVLGSLLNIIMPIVSILLELAGFEIILKAVAFILNIIATAFAWVADAIGHVYNFISKFVNKVTFGLVDMGTMATDNFNKMRESIEVERNYDEYQNNSSSSTVQGDMYINIYYNHSYVNGDAREIALNIRDEIRFAESAGY